MKTIVVPQSADIRNVQPGWLRLTHWVNVLAVLVMLMSGWRIYNASPLFDFRIPDAFTLGGWLGGALLWHFAAMWLLVINGLLYLGFNIATGRIGKKLLPVSLTGVFHDAGAALAGRLSHADLRHYNQVQKAAYLFVILDLALLLLSGLAIWKPVQFSLLSGVLGGYDFARLVHFVAMTLLLAFVLVHVVMVLVVPRSLRTMITGR